MEDMLKVILTNKVTLILYILLVIVGIYITIATVISLVGNSNYFKFKVLNGINDFRFIFTKMNDQKFSKPVRYTNTFNYKLTILEKLEIRYIEKPTLKRIIPFANIYLLLLFAFVLFIIGFWISYLELFFIPASVFFGILVSILLFFILDIKAKVNNESIRKIMPTFVSTLNEYATVKEDVLYILEKSISVTPEPLRTYVSDCIIQIKNGLNDIEALEILSLKVDSEQFKDFIVNLQQSRKYRGNLKKLLDNLANEFYDLEEEFERRKITTLSSRIKIYLFMVVIAGGAYIFIKTNNTVREFYMGTTLGKSLITIFLGIYILAFFISTTITDFNY